MKLTVLMDNTTTIDTPFLGESGLSFLLEADDRKILFDTGFSPLFLSNARKMGVDMSDLSCVCISHGHNDHTNGLPALGRLLQSSRKRIPLVMHPDCIQKKWWRNKDGSIEEIGMPWGTEMLEKYFDIDLNESRKELASDLYFLGSIPRQDSAANEPIGLLETKEGQFAPDYVLDDTAIVFDGKEGLVVINGCAHSGLVNILDYVSKLFPGKPLAAVIGGFHMLAKEPSWLEDMSQKMKAYEPQKIYPCHCTDEASRAALRMHFSVGMIGVGSILEFK